VRRARSSTNERFFADRRSPARKGAHPVMMGQFNGCAVHHVGNQSSRVKRKLMSDSVFFAPAGLIDSQKRSRKSQLTRITLPISFLSRAIFFAEGSSGTNSITPDCPTGAFKSESGTVTRTRGASTVDPPV